MSLCHAVHSDSPDRRHITYMPSLKRLGLFHADSPLTLGQRHAPSTRVLPQRMGCIDHHWCRSSRRRDSHQAVSGRQSIFASQSCCSAARHQEITYCFTKLMDRFQLVTGRVWRGSAFGGVKGRSEIPGIVDGESNYPVQYLAGPVISSLCL